MDPKLTQQPTHKTSIVSIIVLLVIAIIVAILGFGRINSIKEQDLNANRQNAAQQQSAISREKAEQIRKAQDANILKDLNDISTESSADEMTKIEASF
jgi:type II secretory pathway pseudopilin PulG